MQEEPGAGLGPSEPGRPPPVPTQPPGLLFVWVPPSIFYIRRAFQKFGGFRITRARTPPVEEDLAYHRPCLDLEKLSQVSDMSGAPKTIKALSTPKPSRAPRPRLRGDGRGAGGAGGRPPQGAREPLSPADSSPCGGSAPHGGDVGAILRCVLLGLGCHRGVMQGLGKGLPEPGRPFITFVSSVRESCQQAVEYREDAESLRFFRRLWCAPSGSKTNPAPQTSAACFSSSCRSSPKQNFSKS